MILQRLTFSQLMIFDHVQGSAEIVANGNGAEY